MNLLRARDGFFALFIPMLRSTQDSSSLTSDPVIPSSVQSCHTEVVGFTRMFRASTDVPSARSHSRCVHQASRAWTKSGRAVP